MPDIEIFTKPGCGWAERNYAALELKGIPYRLVPACDRFGRKTAEFLSLSPYARTPTVRADGRVIYESTIINEYFDEAYPEPQLRPASAHARAQDRLWEYHCDLVLIPHLNGLTPKADEEQRRQARDGLYRALEQVLRWGDMAQRKTKFWRSDDIGLVDLTYHTFFNALKHVNGLSPVPQFELPQELQSWADLVSDHPVVRKAKQVAESAVYAPNITNEVP